jgi:hypothetical protein
MKKLLLSIFSILFIGASAQIPTSGMVAGYDFNGNANDVSGNGHNGTVTGATLTTSRIGMPNSAYRFNGTSNYITVPNSVTLTPSTNQFTLCTEVKVEGFYAGQCQVNTIFNKPGTNGNGQMSIEFGDNAYDIENCSNLDSAHETFVVIKSGLSSSNPQLYQPYIVRNQWYCVIATFDGDSMKMYLDGVKKVALSAGTTLGYNTSDLVFGHLMSTQFPYWFKGVIDDARIYNRVLSQSEISGYCSFLAGVDEADELSSAIQLYPNPSNGKLNISLNRNLTGQLTISNLLGEIIYSEKLNGTAGSTNTINLNTAAGVYFLKVSDGKKSFTRKLVIE